MRTNPTKFAINQINHCTNLHSPPDELYSTWDNWRNDFSNRNSVINIVYRSENETWL